MAIKKNDNESYTTDVTVMRFPKNTAIAVRPNISYRIYKYVQMNNKYFECEWYLETGESVEILAEIEQNAEGVFYGYDAGSGNINRGHKIRKNGSNIEWCNGDTVVASVPWDDKKHIFGWIGGETNGSKWCKAWYDKRILKNSQQEEVEVKGANCGLYARIGGLLEGDIFSPSANKSCIHSTGSWAIRIYEVSAYGYTQYGQGSGKAPKIYDYYACKYSDLSGNPMLVDVRCKLANVTSTSGDTVSGVTSSISLVDFASNEAGIGIQLPGDFVTAFGCSYGDFNGCVCQDGGIDRAAGFDEYSADVPYLIDSKPFAFYLPNMPAETYTKSNNGSTESYTNGELRRGRRPKWSIWNDAVKFGKHGVEVSGNKVKMKFNILKGNDAVARKPEMLDFDGYDTSKTFPPSFSLDGLIRMEYHNGVASTMNRDALLIGNGQPDEHAVFAYSANAGGLGKVILGNLPLWNYSQAEQMASAGLNLLWACGGGLVIKEETDGGGWQDFATLLAFSSQYSGSQIIGLSSDSDSTLVNLLKVNGIEGSTLFTERATPRLRDELSQNGMRNLKATMVLANAKSDNPADNNLIDVSDFVPTKYSSVVGFFDARIGGHLANPIQGYQEDDRFMMGENGGVAVSGSDKYIIEIVGARTDQWDNYSLIVGTGSTTYGKGIGMPFALHGSNGYATIGTSWIAYLSAVSEAKTYDNDSFEQTDISEATNKTYSFSLGGNVKHVEAKAIIQGFDQTSLITKSVVGDTTTFTLTVPHTYNAREKAKVSLFIVTYASSQSRNAMLDIDVTQYMESTLTVVLSKNGTSTTVTTSWDNFYEVYESCSIVLSRTITNRLYGFTKLLNPKDSTVQSDYHDPIAQYGAGDKWYSLHVSPSGNTVQSGQTAAALFLWKHLRGDDDTTGDRPTDALTAHMKVFPASSGPHAWDIYNGNGKRFFETNGENPYLEIAASGSKSAENAVFHNHDRLLSGTNFVDAWMTLWDNGFTTQKTDSTALDGRTIKIYEEEYDEPKNARVRTKIFESAITDGGHTNDTSSSYSCNIETGQTYPEWSQMPTAVVNRGYNKTGFFHITVTNGSASPKPGAVYLIEIV